MNLATHFGIIWRRKWRVLIATIVVVGGVFAWRDTRPRVYSGSTLLSVTPARTTSSPIGSKDEVQFLCETYAALATTRPVLNAAKTAAGLPFSVGTLQQNVSTDTSKNAGFIEVNATASTAADAQAISKAVADALVAEVARQQDAAKVDDLKGVEAEVASVSGQLLALPPNSPQRAALEAQYTALVQARVESQVRPVDRVQVVAPARASDIPVSPRPYRDALLALAVALVVNCELVVLIETLSDRFSVTDEAEEIADITGLPVLARVPRGSVEDSLEEIRTLRAALMLTATTLRTVAIVGAEQGSGKSFISRRLAAETAAMNIPVLLVDGDLRRPTVHAELSLPRSPGLSDLLQGASVHETVRDDPDHPNLSVLTAGSVVADPLSLLSGYAVRESIKKFTRAELVIVDTPASSFFADAAAIASQCDVTVVVVNAQRSRRRTVRKLVAQLQHAGAHPLGVVINWAESAPRSASYYYAGQRVSI